MKRLLLIPLVLLALAGTGCTAAVTTSVLQGGASITKPIANPVQPVNIAQAKTVYVATLEVAAGYRDFCWARPYAALMADSIAMPLCQNRRANVRAMQAADTKAFAAIRTAENFQRNNPTVSATSLLLAAWTAVTDFQSLVAGVAK